MKEYDLDASQVGRSNVSPKASSSIVRRNIETKEGTVVARASARVSHTLGTSACAGVRAGLTNRKSTSNRSDGQELLLKLQRDYGNRYTQRVMGLARKGQGDDQVRAEVEQSIASKRGGGQALDQGIQEQMESAFNADFSGVRVHTDRKSNSLNRELNARAFTTGQDIFFREGAYNPGSSGGRELLAHELTHVVQQAGDLQRKMTLGQPGDIYEREADEAARAVMQQEQRATSAESGKDEARRQTEEEEKESLAAKLQGPVLQRQAESEEGEELQTEPEPEELSRQEEPEEEEAPVSAKAEVGEIRRQTEEEEEQAVSAKAENRELQRQEENEREIART